MLYIFHVDTGTMMTFDMNLALDSVAHLQAVIDKAWRIPVEKQVLLVSGGESLDPSARVCSYSAGTDTNPIYLFSKSVIESTNPPTPSIDSASDFDFKEQVDATSTLPATYNTVVTRAQLAGNFWDNAREQTKICEKLVHDQHLQQQGWAAVVANLEDITAEFKARSDRFQNSFNQYLEMRDSYLDFLKNFSNDLLTLSKIPILPALQASDLELTPVSDKAPEVEADSASQTSHTSNTSNTSNPDSNLGKSITLLQWISAADNQSSLDQVAEQCSRGLEQLDARVIETLCNDVKTALDSANNVQMKEVKGLGDRLYGLEQLMCESKKMVQEQGDLAQAFLQNQNRASNLGDPSILPDLCASHKRQLLVMLENHQRLRDIRRRCTRAKEELSVNLYHRLKWIMYVENLILETDHKLMIYHESLKRLRRHVEIIQQIHLAPSMYLSAVAEVVRRRAFSQAFLLWASELACHILTIHNDEVARRKEFQTQFEGHFLSSLFPGLEDMPPSFATQAPSIFDSKLPKLTTEDIERLKSELPDLAQNISIPDVSAITQFFFVKSLGKEDKVDERAVEEKLVQAVSDAGLASNLDRGLLKPSENETFLSAHAGLPHLKDLDKGCESETDTEEFEKVGQSPLELQFESSKNTPAASGHTDASTITEDNLSSSKLESEKFKKTSVQLTQLANIAITQLKEEILDIKAQYTEELRLVKAFCVDVNSQWEEFVKETEVKHREALQRLTVDHELEQSDLKKVIQSKCEEIQGLRKENQFLESSVHRVKNELKVRREEYDRSLQERDKHISELKKHVEGFQEEKEKSVKEAKDVLSKEYKAEMESIRTRFKLFTLKDRSPSDSSLEKIDHNVIDVSRHQEIVQQLRDDLAMEKEKAVNEAIVEERQRWESKLEQELTQSRIRNEQEKQVLFNEAMRRVVDEKEKQIELLREREAVLNLECIKYKNTIQQLADTENDNSSHNSTLLDKMDALQRDKCQLEAELSAERSRRLVDTAQDLTASVAVFEGKCDVATSPTHKLTRSQTNLIQTGKLNIASCSAGDLVLVVFDFNYKNYTIVQASNVLYFLHTDSYEPMGLKHPEPLQTMKLYAMAEVVDKEYCHAKKMENRYHVPKGTKFYRVKVKPFPHSKRQCSMHASTSSTADMSYPSMSQSQTTDQASSVIFNKMAESQSVPTSPLKEAPAELTDTGDSGIDGGSAAVDSDVEQRFDSLAILPEGESSEQEQYEKEIPPK